MLIQVRYILLIHDTFLSLLLWQFWSNQYTKRMFLTHSYKLSFCPILVGLGSIKSIPIWNSGMRITLVEINLKISYVNECYSEWLHKLFISAKTKTKLPNKKLTNANQTENIIELLLAFHLHTLIWSLSANRNVNPNQTGLPAVVL